MEYIGIYWNILEYIGIYWNILEYIDYRLKILENPIFSGIFYWNRLEYPQPMDGIDYLYYLSI